MLRKQIVITVKEYDLPAMSNGLLVVKQWLDKKQVFCQTVETKKVSNNELKIVVHYLEEEPVHDTQKKTSIQTERLVANKQLELDLLYGY